MELDYPRKLAIFVRTGAELIRESIPERYQNRVPANRERPLEPGFIPPEREARVTVISYYPNESDLRGHVDYDTLRNNFARWGSEGTVESYRAAYNDWIASLPHIPFYRERTLRVIEGLGIAPQDITWLPLVKVPLPAKTVPEREIIEIDREDLWKQVQLLRPTIVWVQGYKTSEWIEPLLRERITDHIITQSLAQQQTKAEAQKTIDGVVRKLARALMTVDAL